MKTADFIESLRNDIYNDLEKKLLEKLTPVIEQRLYGNVFDFQEAIRYLHLSDSTLRRMVADREIPFFRQRGQIFFRQTSLEQWIRDQERKNCRLYDNQKGSA